MSKKKLMALLVTSVLTITIVGGTLAWFTSRDSVINKFSIDDSGSKTRDLDTEIKIHEKFDCVDASKMAPGRTVEKKVQVCNIAQYDQFIRVKITKQPKDEDDNVITENMKKPLDLGKIQLNFTNYLLPKDKDNKGLTEGYWYYNKADDYYYYIGKVTSEVDTIKGKNGGYTNTLLDSVTLSKDAGNEYKNIKFDVHVKAESIQATNDAYKDWAPENLKARFEELQKGKVTKPTDKIIEG